MVSQTITINNADGLQVRQASKFIAFSNKFISSIKMTRDDHTVNAKSILSLISLSAKKGDQVTVIITGDDEETALAEIVQFLEEMNDD